MDWVLQIIVQVAVAGAIYGGIRSDLRHAVQSSESAHRRIDDMLMKGASHGKA